MTARWKPLPTLALVVGALYCLFPVVWVAIAATKTRAELFSTTAFLPSFNGGLWDNLGDLFAYQDGQFWRWALNSVLYAGVGAALAAVVSALAGYGLAKYRFAGRNAIFNMILAGVLLPQIILAVPQYLLLSEVGLAGTYWSVLLPRVISPFGIYLCRIYAAASVPTEMLEAGRIDGAGEWRLFRSVALPLMAPGAGDRLPAPVRRLLEQLPAALHHALGRRHVPDHGRAVHDGQPGRPAAGALRAGDRGRPALDHPADRALPRPPALLADRPHQRRPEGMTARRPTIDDVARVAGVSRGTVSRVLNGGRYVSPAALRAVELAMTETGYVVNTSARALVTRRSGAIAVVLSEPQERLFEDPNFSTLLRAASQRLAESDLSMVLMIAGNADERDRVARFARAGHVDGALLISTHAGDPIFDELQAAGVPIVACGRPLDRGDAIPFVAADDREGARQMVRYLRESGRARIGTITGPLDTPGGRDRLAGYRDVLGDEAVEARIVPAREYTYKAGEEAMERLLGRAADLDAVFVASDLVAAGALATLRRAGRTVPDDIAVAGFDDSQIAIATTPPLTTIRHPLDQVAHTMVDMVVKHIAGEPVASQLVPTELVRRESA